MTDKRIKEYSDNIIKVSHFKLKIILRKLGRLEAGDYQNTQARWNARKEKRKIQSLISSSESNNKKKRL